MSEVSLYNGEVTISFNPGSHRYKWVEENEYQKGVTTILNGAFPKNLTDWAARVAVDEVQGKYLAFRNEYGEMDITAFAAICEEAKDAHIRLRDKGGQVGTDAHAYCSAALCGEEPALPSDPQVAAACRAFDAWRKAADIRLFSSEQIVFSRRHRYCGTTDFFGNVNGKQAVLDFKSGSGFYPDAALQLAAYAVALEEEHLTTIPSGWIIHLDKNTSVATPYHVPITPELKDRWLAVKKSYHAIQDTEKEVKELKDANGYNRNRVHKSA